MKRTKLTMIFSAVGALGVIATGALSVWATVKAVKLLERNELQLKDIQFNKETIKQVWKSYILPGSVAVAAVGSVLVANGINKKTIVTLASGVVALSESYDIYRKRVIDEAPELNAKISEEMAKGHYVTPDGRDMGEKVIFYEPYSQRTFERSWYEISDAFYHFNRNFALRGYAYLNELFSFLGLSKTVDGDIFGYCCDWFYEDGLIPWLDYDVERKRSADGDIYNISYVWPAQDLHMLDEGYPNTSDPSYFVSPT